MGVVVARPRRREYRSFGRRKHAGEACSIITGMITFKEGTLHPVSLGRGLDLNGLPPLHVYVSLSATALGGSTMQTGMLSQVEAQLLQLRCPNYPEALHTRTTENSPPSKEEPNARDSKPTQDPKENVPKRHKIRSCSICLISNTFTDKEF